MRPGRIGFWYRLAIWVCKPPLLVFTRRDWRGRENVPLSGPVIVAANHVAHIDPLTLTHYFVDSGRLPRYLAKSELFAVPGLRRLLRGTGQIPVRRRTVDANAALADAVAALERGECVVVYPEGTITRDPDGWPMVARTGVARLALATGAPVLPVAQWGAQQILPAYTKRPHLLPRKTVRVAAGRPVDLSGYDGSDPSPATLRAATADVMSAVRELVGELRDETPPLDVFDPARSRARGDRRSA